ncbi:VRR-NUC domain-containing protein [Dehalobacter sp. TeCB1]|uniref:VRR-NUC domain-containing protein n=1 Tax=Dehalobacter sp. TeCB1 TaxID=1843715 RepID=UPI00083B7D69|nr:VRR-NUC domain-containing protein [Dehalobacter sp. TeCB1]OCZ54328.1 nuclease [Dehalobacter sp. TeCB1]
MRESYIEKKLRIEIERLGGKVPKWVSPGNRGVPDRLVILPGGRTIYVETKAPGKPLEPLQEKWAKTLRKMGHRVYKIDSVQDIEEFIQEVIQE